MGPFRRRRIIGALDRMDPARQPFGVHDGSGEVVPRADTLVRVVVGFGIGQADIVPVDDGDDGGGQVCRPCRGAYLIEHHADRVPLAAEPEHGFDEILPVDGVEPGGPDDHVRRGDVADRLFPLPLGLPVDAERRGKVVFPVWAAVASVEDVVRRDMQEKGVAGFCRGGEHGRTVPVHPVGRFLIGFRPVDRCIGRTVDNRPNGAIAAEALHMPRAGDVEFRQVPEIPGVADMADLKLLQFGAELPLAAGDENIHSNRMVNCVKKAPGSLPGSGQPLRCRAATAAVHPFPKG